MSTVPYGHDERLQARNRAPTKTDTRRMQLEATYRTDATTITLEFTGPLGLELEADVLLEPNQQSVLVWRWSESGRMLRVEVAAEC